MHKKKPLTLQQKIDAEVGIFKQQSFSRSEIAQRLYNSQDGETQDAIDAMTERIVSVSRGLISVRPNGTKDAVAVTLPNETIKENAFYLAVEIVKDLAMFDIRIANFRFDPKLCAACSKLLKPSKKQV
jgi:hypothetical protein